MQISWIRRLALTGAVLAALVRPVDAQVVSQTAAASAAESSEIARTRDEYLVATKVRDVEKISSLYAEDAVLVPADGVVLRGREAISKYFAECFRRPAGERVVTVNTFRTESGAGFASETGRFEETGTIADGSAARVSGVYVTIYTRSADGRWRMAVNVRSRGNHKALVDW